MALLNPSPRREFPRRRPLAAVLLVLLCVFGSPLQAAAADKPTDYDVIAAYLPVFFRYVTWPEGIPPEGDPLRIGLVGKDPFGSTLERILVGRVINGRKLELVRTSNLDKLRACQILFVNLPASEQKPVLENFSGKPVLTVVYRGSASASRDTDAVVEFVLSGANVRYVLDASALALQGLRPTQGLLENALRVGSASPSTSVPSREQGGRP